MVWWAKDGNKLSPHQHQKQQQEQQHNKDSVTSSFSPSSSSVSSKVAAYNNKQKQTDGRIKGTKPLASSAVTAIVAKAKAPLNMDEMNVHDTTHGIEVSFDFPGTPKQQQKEEREPQQKPREPVISIKEQIRQRQKVYRTQFSVSFPALPQAQQSSNTSTNDNNGGVSSSSFDHSWRPKNHRIPLLGYSMGDVSQQDVMGLLLQQNNSAQGTKDEYSAVQQELQQLDVEISALDKDRSWLETSLRNMSKSFPSFSSSSSSSHGKSKQQPTKNKGGGGTARAVDWDVRTILSSAALQEAEQLQLQKVRGNCLTLHMQNSKAREAFLSKCGSHNNKHDDVKQPPLRQKRPRAPGVDTVTLGPDNCRPGGAGATVRHVSVMSGGGTGANNAFFMSRDTGKSFTWGRFPPKLFRRMKENKEKNGDLVYLSTGPQGSYFAEFKSGECWWGSAVADDDDFHSILQAWDVYRVVFGPIIAFEEERGNKKMTNSWIILGRDGRAAWKNLPSRLHHQLESRLANQSAPAEVALGSGDSYYVRYLDDTVDYCLPAVVADVCEHIELYGASITDIVLHPEISHDFVIRHTEMKS